MSDLVKALRDEATWQTTLYPDAHVHTLLAKAADEIERLQNQTPRGEDLANIMTGDE